MNACKSEPRQVGEEPKQANDFPIYAKQTVIPLYPDTGGHTSPRLTLTVDVPVLSGPLKDLTQELLYSGIEPEAYMEQLTGFYENQYFEMKTVREEYPDLPEASLNWEYLETISTDFPADRIMVISRTREYYLGGAHGMREKQYFVINTEQKKQLRLEDTVKAEALPPVRRYIQEELRVFSGIDAEEPLKSGGFFEDQVEIPDNFFLTSKGLGFHWNPYEIAPYVMGPIEVVIPYEKLKNMLTL